MKSYSVVGVKMRVRMPLAFSMSRRRRNRKVVSERLVSAVMARIWWETRPSGLVKTAWGLQVKGEWAVCEDFPVFERVSRFGFGCGGELGRGGDEGEGLPSGDLAHARFYRHAEDH